MFEIITLLLVFFTGLAVIAGKPGTFSITSPAFPNNGPIPVKYAREGIPEGKNISFPLQWNDPPAGTKSFALSVVDPHPVANNWIHWLVVNIPAHVASLPEGASGKNMPPGAVELMNSFRTKGYGGPQPPKGTGKHPYEATLYALSVESVQLPESASLVDFTQALQGKILGKVKITGTFER